jgi:Iron-containing redox enzyme
MSDHMASKRCRRKIELVLPFMFASAARLLRSHNFAKLLPKYLVAIHGVIRASVPLMEAAQANCANRAKTGSSFDFLLAEYFAKHIEEERDHDLWVLEDLEVIGYSRHSVQSLPPLQCIVELVGSQYYWVLHHHSVALLGYIAILEGYPMSAEAINELQQRTQYPPAAFRTIRKHALIDPHHREDLDQMLDKLQLSEASESLIIRNAVFTVQKIAQLFCDVGHISIQPDLCMRGGGCRSTR